MTLREKQSAFLVNVAKLILWADTQGYQLTGGELGRTTDQQILYYRGYTIKDENGIISLVKANKLSKTMDSKHLKKLAIDLYLFKNNKYISSNDEYKPLAEFWVSLHPDNVAGYYWNFDGNHFEMK